MADEGRYNIDLSFMESLSNPCLGISMIESSSGVELAWEDLVEFHRGNGWLRSLVSR